MYNKASIHISINPGPNNTVGLDRETSIYRIFI